MNELASLPAIPSREQIEALQTELLKLPQIEPVTKHYFADGMYCREVFRPVGTLIVGKVHKKEHFFIVSTGEMTFWTEEGMKRVRAPFVWVSRPGTKRVTLAHEDTTAITVHRVSSQNLEEIEVELVEDEPASAYGPGNILNASLLESLK